MLLVLMGIIVLGHREIKEEQNQGKFSGEIGQADCCADSCKYKTYENK